MMWRPKALATVLVTGLILAACGSDADDAGRQGSPETTSPAQTTGTPDAATGDTRTAEPSEDAEPTPTRDPGPPDPDWCKADKVKLSLGRGGGAAGTHWRPLRFTNTGDMPCVIQGFPGVSYRADGEQVGEAAFRSGSKGKAMTLEPGDTAHAPVGFAQVRNFDEDACRPTRIEKIRVYPPQETAYLEVPYQGIGCAKDVSAHGHQLIVRTIKAGRG